MDNLEFPAKDMNAILGNVATSAASIADHVRKFLIH